MNPFGVSKKRLAGLSLMKLISSFLSTEEHSINYKKKEAIKKEISEYFLVNGIKKPSLTNITDFYFHLTRKNEKKKERRC